MRALKILCMLSVLVVPASALASTGSNILGGAKFSFANLFSSSDVSSSHHADREEYHSRSAARTCWTENTWQDTRHGRTIVKRERKCR